MSKSPTPQRQKALRVQMAEAKETADMASILTRSLNIGFLIHLKRHGGVMAALPEELAAHDTRGAYVKILRHVSGAVVFHVEEPAPTLRNRKVADCCRSRHAGRLPIPAVP